MKMAMIALALAGAGLGLFGLWLAHRQKTLAELLWKLAWTARELTDLAEGQEARLEEQQERMDREQKHIDARITTLEEQAAQEKGGRSREALFNEGLANILAFGLNVPTPEKEEMAYGE